MIKKIISEPLLHFIALSLCFFIVYNALNPQTVGVDKIITITDSRVEQLYARFEKTWQRVPAKEEKQKLIRSYALDEIYAREAQALGLGDNDAVVKRRLRQKMEFMLEDMSALKIPSDMVLQQFYQDNSADYRSQNQYSFSQCYFSTDRPEEELQEIIDKQKKVIAQGEDPVGDNSLLPAVMNKALVSQIERQFGTDFTLKLKQASLQEWVGPVASGLGLHFVKVTERTLGELPALEKVKSKVLSDWRYDENKRVKDEYEQALLEQYQIDVTTP